MPRGLYRDGEGWVEVDYSGVQSPMSRQKYISGRYLPPYYTLPEIAAPSPERINDPEYWRSRAEEARVIAGQMIDEAAIATMRKVVEQYEELAEMAERARLAKKSTRFAKKIIMTSGKE
jgi:hypothetical protein